MRRRKFITSAGFVAALSVAGCSGSGNSSPPPRKSNVFQAIRATDGELKVSFEDNTWVMSRYDSGGSNDLADPDDVGGLAPVGGARAKGKGGSGGRGATGRASGGYSSAPKTRHGRAWWHGGSYADDWYEDHGDEVSRYGVAVATLGVAYLGNSFEMEDDAPGAGPVPWDCTTDDPSDTAACPIQREGWYRVGAELVGPSGHDFEWEAVDLKVDDSAGGYEVEKQWKVSPRI